MFVALVVLLTASRDEPSMSESRRRPISGSRLLIWYWEEGIEGVGCGLVVLSQVGWMEMQVETERCDWWSPAYMTLSKIMTLLSSVPGDSELRDLMSGAIYSR